MSDHKDEKYELYSSDDDQYQESIVTGGDGRRRIDVFKPQLDDIFGCIGQLDVEYDYMDKHKYRGFGKGTGTVIFVGNANKNKKKLGYILTCAHNVRLSLTHCTKQQCNTYRRKGVCTVCKESTGPEQHKKVVKATKIIFRDRSIEYNNYGKTVENYKCTELYVPDIKYMNYPKPKDGYDWAFLSFVDSSDVYK
eukprot:312036_1